MRFALGAGLVAAACSGAARVPPGLPPPEYERPEVTPWPSGDAGLEAPQDPEAPAAPASPSPPGSGSAGAPGD